MTAIGRALTARTLYFAARFTRARFRARTPLSFVRKRSPALTLSMARSTKAELPDKPSATLLNKLTEFALKVNHVYGA